MPDKSVRLNPETAILLNRVRAIILNKNPEKKATDDTVITYALKRTLETEKT